MNYLHLAYAILGTLILSHLLRRFLQGSKHRSQLPPKFPGWDPIANIDWTIATHTNASNILAYSRKHGATYRLSSIRTHMRAIVTSDVENVNAVFSGKDWGVGFRLDGMGPMMGVGFLTMDGEEWSRSRKMLRPSFAKANLEDLGLLGEAIDGMVKGIPEGETVDVEPLLQKTFMDSSLNFILGMDLNEDQKTANKPPMTVKEFLALWQKGLMGMGLRLINRRFLFLVPTKGHFEVCRKLHSFIHHYIDQSIAKSASAKSGKKSMVDVALNQTDDTTYVCHQLSQGMLASQETTSVLTSNVIQLLAQRPDLWKELREEVLAQGDALLNYDALRDNNLLQHTLLETLRFRPVFPAIGRMCMQDTTLPTNSNPTKPGPFPVPAGTMAIMDLMSMFRNTEVFGPDVDTFNPRRWDTIKPSARQFTPFGSGPRACLGREKVLVEAAYLLAKLLREFEAVEARNLKVKMTVMISMKNTEGCKVAFKRAGKGV